MINIFVISFLTKGNAVLLVRRRNQTFGKGLYSMVGGKLEENETLRQAIKREVFEETALDIPESSFELAHVFHRKGTETELISLVFKADISNFSPHNNEPEKHDDMAFFEINNLPENIIPAHKQAIECIAKNITYSEHGWQK